MIMIRKSVIQMGLATTKKELIVIAESRIQALMNVDSAKICYLSKDK